MAGSFLYLLNAAKWCSLQLAVIVGVIYACSAGFMKGFIAPIAIIFFVMGFANSKEPICAKLFQNSDICYEIYLYAFPVQQIIIDILYVRAGWRGISIFLFHYINGDNDRNCNIDQEVYPQANGKRIELGNR